MTEQLIEGLDKVTRIAGKDSVILVDVNDQGTLKVAGYDEQHYAIYSSSVNEVEPFRIMMDPEVSSQILRNFSGAEFRLTEDHGSLIATTNRSEARFPLSLVERFRGRLEPRMENESQEITLPVDEFIRVFKDTRYASNSSQVGDVRFKGFHLSYSEGMIETMATDGVLMATARTPVPSDTEEFSFITNPDMFRAVEAVAGADLLTLTHDEIRVKLRAAFPQGVLTVVSALVKGAPLPYRPIVNSATGDDAQGYSINRRELSKELGKLSYFSKDSTRHRLEVEVEAKEMRLRVGGHEGEAGTVVPVEPLGEYPPIKTVVNWRYMNSAVSSMGTETVLLRIKSPTMPLSLDSQESTVSIIGPVAS